jgi:hypothetical protein
MRTPTLLFMLLGLLTIGCGGSSSNGAAATDSGTTTTTDTSGGEVEGPRTLYTTTPVPVPQPAVARDRLAQPTQSIWLEVETAIAQRPPEPPSAADEEALRAWYGDAFAPWLSARIEAGRRAEGHAGDLEGAPPWERGVAAGLLGYFHEQTAAEARGAPIPPSIVSDAELLAIYSQSLDEALMPLARRSLEAYRFCLAAFEELAGTTEGPQWSTWSEWCEDRGEEVFRVYSHTPEPGDESAASSTTPAASTTPDGAQQ